MPQDDFRRESGLFNNKRNDEMNENHAQQVLNFIASNSGHTLTEQGIRHPVGWLYTWMTLGAIVPPVDRLNQRSSPTTAFEADTRIDLRSEGNQTRIHSFHSSSTVIPNLIHRRSQVPLIENISSSFLADPQIEPTINPTNNSFTQIRPFYPHQNLELKPDIAEVAHEFSLSIHKIAHDIEELMNCTLTKRATQMKKWIFWGEDIEQTQLRTVCKVAVAKAKKENGERPRQRSQYQHFSFHRMPNNSTPEANQFKANEKLEKLREIFQVAIENKQSQHGNTTDKKSQSTDKMSNETDYFLDGLTETFSQFFREYEHTNYTKEQAGANGGSVMAHFIDLLLRTFSVDYGKHGPDEPQTRKNMNLPMKTHPNNNVLSHKTSIKKVSQKKQGESYQEKASNLKSETQPVLKSEERRVLAQIYQLASDFLGRADRFVQKTVGLQFLAAEAKSIPTDRQMQSDHPVSNDPDMKSYQVLSRETLMKLNYIIMAYLDNSPSPESTATQLEPFWYDYEVYEKRGEIEKVNQALTQFLCEQSIPCEGLSTLQLFNALKNWISKAGEKNKLARKLQVAQLILKTLGLPSQGLSDKRGEEIIIQWRNNNIFKDYTFALPPKLTVKEEDNHEATNPPIKTTTSLPPVVIDPQLQSTEEIPLETRIKLQMVFTKYMYGQMLDGMLKGQIPENLPPLWYDRALFERRDAIDKVNDSVNVFICQKKRRCSTMSGQELLLEVQHWERVDDVETERSKRKQVAEIILRVSGLPPRNLTDETVASILMQWRNNNLFKNYQFKSLEKAYTEIPIFNTSQSMLTTPTRIAKKGDGAILPQLTVPTTQPVVMNDAKRQKKKGTSTTKENSEFDEKAFGERLNKVNSIIVAFFEGKPSPVPTSEKLAPMWYEQEIFNKINLTQNVNDAIKKFLCEQKVPCENLSPLQLILATQEFLRRDGKEVELSRNKQVAEIILNSSGLTGQTIADTRATAIILQWRNNNIFRDYTFFPANGHEEVEILNNDLIGIITSVRPNTYGSLPVDIVTTVNNMHVAYMKKLPLPISIEQPLIPLWYDYELFQDREKTKNANQFVQKFLYSQQFFNDDRSPQGIVLAAHEWINDGQVDSKILERQKQLVPNILEGHGMVRQNLTAVEETNIYFQWKTNNMLNNYQFIELKLPVEKGKVTETSEMKVIPSTMEDSDLALVHTIVVDIVKNVTPVTHYAEPLPILYFHFGLFLRRDETNMVNQKLKEFFSKAGIEIKDTTSNELEKAQFQWIEKGGTSESNNTSEREQFLAYFIAKAYGLTDIRFGEFWSSIKIQEIFNQWKSNTLLEGYTFKEMSPETIHYQLGKIEHPNVVRLNLQNKESKQIFSDFINDRSPTISKTQPISKFYHHQLIFDQRGKTPEVNEVVKKFLQDRGISFKHPTTSELVRQLQVWLLEGPTYEAIIEREIQIARIIQAEYGSDEEEVTATDARYIILQWENNNAQIDYTYKENKEWDAVDISEIEATVVQQEKIDAFTRENNAVLITDIAIEDQGESILELTEQQKETIQKKIVSFLAARDIEVDITKPNELILKTAEWATIKVNDEVKINSAKVNMLANLILGKNAGAEIADEKAEVTFKNWLYDMASGLSVTPAEPPKEEKTSTITVTPATTTSKIATSTQSSNINENQRPKYVAPNWRDPNLKVQVAQFFRQEGVLKGDATQANILFAMGTWFTQDGTGMVLSYDKLQKFSKVILNQLKLYGGGQGEKISDRAARSTIMNWVFENVLDSSVEVYMLKKILDSPDPSQFTMGSLRKLFEIDELNAETKILEIPEEELTVVKKLWVLFLKEVLPNYLLDVSMLPDETPISNYNSLMQLTGTRLLEDAGIRTSFTQEEIQKFGSLYWEKISKTGVKRVDELRYIVTPAMLAVAQLNPDLLLKALEEGNYQEVAVNTFLNYWKNSYFILTESLESLYEAYGAYQKEAINWRRKQVLAKEVAQLCAQYDKDRAKLYTSYAIEQDYLSGALTACRNYTPPNLEEWYTRLTKAVSDAYYPFDQKLIDFALLKFNEKEQEFMFSPETQIYEATAKLKHVMEVSTIPSGYRLPPDLIIELELENTDLFVAVNGKEERCYGLKKLDKSGGYVFYRVDDKPMLYLINGLFNQKEHLRGGYKEIENGVQIGKREFLFYKSINRDKRLSQGKETQSFIEGLASKHRDNLYQNLYQSGNDRAISDQVLEVLQSIIPFYDCVIGISNQDASVAVPACVLDALLLIPFLGQVTSLNMKFALGMAKAIATGGIRQAIRVGGQFIPNFSESKLLLAHLIRYIDPGVEPIIDGGKFILKELVALKNEIWVASDVKKMLEKASNLNIQPPVFPKDVSIARLPEDGLEVPVKHMKDDIYRIVTDLTTGDVYGNAFNLRGNQLEVIADPVSFTQEQKALITRLSKDINPDHVFLEEPNLNPSAYGSGTVLTIPGRGQETKYFIDMNGQTVPVRVRSVENHKVRYDVIDGENIYPVNCKGKKWYFEETTSPSIPKELAEDVMKKIDEFDSIKDPSFISAPDEKGLRWNRWGKSYIKINDHYIPLISIPQGENRYYLLKKDVNQWKTVLSYTPDTGTFRLETIEEKVISDNRLKSRSWKVTFPKFGNQKLPPFKKMPKSPGKGQYWNELRNTIPAETKYKKPDTKKKIDRINDNILNPISTFIPEPKPVVYNNQKWNRDFILKTIIEELPKEPAIGVRIYSGLDASKSPEFLQQFLIDLRKDIDKSIDYYDKAIEVFAEALTKDRIAESKIGTYLVKFFQLESVPNQEPILLESLNRLISVVQKGRQFLQQTADWDYENILVVSTDLVRQGDSQEFRTLYKEYIETKAEVFSYDPECRMVIFADAFHLDPGLAKGKEIGVNKVRALLHETSHLSSGTVDLMAYATTKLGVVKTGKMMVDEYVKNFESILNSEGFTSLVEEIAEFQNKPGLTKETVWNELKKNNVLRVNVQISDADMIAMILRDAAEGRDFDGVVRVARGLDDVTLGNGLLSTFLALEYVQDHGYFDKYIQLNQTMIQEHTTTIPSQTNVTAKVSDHQLTNLRKKREIDQPDFFTRGQSKRALSSIESTIEEPNRVKRSVSNDSNERTGMESAPPSMKRSFLNLVVSSTEKSTMVNSERSNQQEVKHQTVPNERTGIESVSSSMKRSFLNLAVTSTEKSGRVNSERSSRQEKKHQPKLVLQL